jgi:hypothetical protein
MRCLRKTVLYHGYDRRDDPRSLSLSGAATPRGGAVRPRSTGVISPETAGMII